ncbi:PREDICTED: protein SKIP34 [Tarenaya hassleriana]|uniref:protein SKIP34 n=1 Tax=Tarenaya hassleriana TaxID=28532 RepID=UPI0008FD0CF3|nr:PREDICTED: protein SKIP34 [Tarenaya hassleriana]
MPEHLRRRNPNPNAMHLSPHNRQSGSSQRSARESFTRTLLSTQRLAPIIEPAHVNYRECPSGASVIFPLLRIISAPSLAIDFVFLFAMCYGHQQPLSRRRRRSPEVEEDTVVEDPRDRIAEMEARLRRARRREAELSRRLEEMKQFVSVMEILESYLKRRFLEQQERVARLFSSITAK